MSSNTNAGGKMVRLSVFSLAIVAIVALAVSVFSMSAPAAQDAPEELSDQELLNRMSRAPEKAPTFNATVNFEQSILPAQLLSALGEGENSASMGSGTQTAQVWHAGAEKLRAEVQSQTGDRVFVSDGKRAWLYNGATNTLRTGETSRTPEPSPEKAVSPEEVSELLAELDETSELTQEEPVRFAGRWAHDLTLSPKDADSTLVNRARVLVDSETHLPLALYLHANGQEEPVVRWEVSELDVGPVPAEQFSFQRPPGAEVLPLEQKRPDQRPADTAEQRPEPREVSLQRARESVDFEIATPQSPPGGRELTNVVLTGSRGVALTYGSGWGTVTLAQSPAEDDPRYDDTVDELPLQTVDLDGVEAKEVSTPVGTALVWDSDGVRYALAGSVPAGELERAARSLQ